MHADEAVPGDWPASPPPTPTGWLSSAATGASPSAELDRAANAMAHAFAAAGVGPATGWP